MMWTISDVVPETFRSFGRNWVTLVVGNLVAMLIAAVPIVVTVAVMVPMLPTQAKPLTEIHQIVFGASIVAFILAIAASIVLWIMFAPALVRIALAAARDQHPRIRDVFDFRRAGTMFGAYLLSGLASFAATLLLVVPGIIVAIALSFVSFYVVDKASLGATDALEASWRATRGHRLRLFGLILLALLANFVLSTILQATVWLMPLRIVFSFVVSPIATLTMAQIYLRIDPESRQNARMLAAPAAEV